MNSTVPINLAEVPTARSGAAGAATANRRPQILCVMRIPPNLEGVGGSQRAWRLLNALRPHGDIHFVLVYRRHDHDCMTTSLEPIEPLCRSVTRICIAGWEGAGRRLWGIVPGKIQDLVNMRSHEAPRLSSAELAQIAAQLPIRDPDVIFAGRLPTAWILETLIERRLLSGSLRVVDLDDVMSKAQRSQIQALRETVRGFRRALMQLDVQVIEAAERRMAARWHGVSVCTDEDVSALHARNPAAVVLKVPNVVDRPLLAPRKPDGMFRLLFVGNLAFSPNIQGLKVFVDKAWPLLHAAVGHARLSIVGINPQAEVVELAKRHGFELHADVPSLLPFYDACDVVIAPILFGSGTRIKILEAMAYGRAVVSTSMGAEGLQLEPGRHLGIADDMAQFARLLTEFAADPSRLQQMAQAARAFQQQHYMPEAVDAAIARLLTEGRRTLSARDGGRARR